MNVVKGRINDILNGRKQFIIPVYQRRYSWEEEQYSKLWEDICKMETENRARHFVGSIVNVACETMPAGIQKFMIIDGQQRMTTLTILLIALRDYVNKNNSENIPINPKEINGIYIQNDYGDGEEKYKMILIQSDKDILIKLIDEIQISDNIDSKIFDAYNFFSKKISEKTLTPRQIYQNIAKLEIVNITLDIKDDNPQLIFESLNSTGMELSQSDLIRNFLLMDLEPEIQKRIHKTYWETMENFFIDYLERSEIMDSFFRDYLTIKTGTIPAFSKIYEDFKKFVNINKGKQNIEDLIKEINKNAKYHSDMYYAKTGDEELDNIFKDIKELKMNVAYPFFLKLYNKYEQKNISKNEFIEILKLSESYVLRRGIVGMSSNSHSSAFHFISTAISESSEQNIVEIVNYYFSKFSGLKTFPTDENFKNEFLVKDIYNVKIRNYILSKLENFKNKSFVNIEKLTIEHILPQNKKLSDEWKKELGENWEEIQNKYLHTIGNLTLTAYNSELSDFPFGKKLEMAGGFKESGLRINSFVIKQNEWKEKQIKERAYELVNKAIAIWEYPRQSSYIPPEKLESVYTLEDYKLSDSMKKLYSQFDKIILNISPDIKKEYKKLYIAYKLDTNFVDIFPQKSKLILSIKIKLEEIHDTKKIFINSAEKGRWGQNNIECSLDNDEHLEYVIEIIKKAYEKREE